MRLGSLFSGIGGLELGLERALGAEVAWQVEIDPYATKVLAKHWPNTRRYEDVRQVGRDTLEAVDVVCGGFPCQGLSNAGKRKGLKDERSGLWEEYARIIGELEPRWVVIENVPGLSSRGIDQVLWSLASLGYDAVWDCLSAAAVGAPHIRDRIFIIGWRASSTVSDPERIEVRQQRQRDGEQQDQQGSTESAHHGAKQYVADAHGEGELQRGGKVVEERRRAGYRSEEANVADAHLEGLEERQGERRGLPPKLSTAMRACGETGEIWSFEPDVGRVADGVPKRMDRIRCLGNGVVPQCSYVIGMWLLEIKKWLEES